MTDGTRPLVERLATGVDRFTARWRPLVRTVDRWVADSRTAVANRRCRRVLASSRLGRWVRREPAGAPTAVSLADGRTTGPFVPVALQGCEQFAAAIRDARVVTAARRVRVRVADEFVRLAGLVVLGAVGSVATISWPPTDPLSVLALAVATIAGVLALAVDGSRTALERSTAARWFVAAFAPPDAVDGARHGRNVATHSRRDSADTSDDSVDSRR